MVESAPAVPAIARLDADAFVGALLHSIAHDLRSPLLTLSLAAELMRTALGDRLAAEPDGAAPVALDALEHGTRDLDRMVQSLANLARARRRPLQAAPVTLRLLLGGHLVISDVDDLDRRLVSTDALVLREMLDGIAGDRPAEIRVTVAGRFTVLALPRPAGLEDASGSPLMALAAAFQRYAGTALDQLAAAQILLERTGGAADIEDARARLWLPDAARASALP